jgi:hypothetical protein
VRHVVGVANGTDAITIALRALGVRPGDEIAVIGDGMGAYWARLARVHLVAELPSSAAETFWAGDSALQRRVLDAIAGTGARAVVADDVPPGAGAAASAL